MNRLAGLVGSTILGTIFGAALLVVVLVGSVVIGFLTGADVLVPGMLRGAFTEVDGLPVFSFVPNGAGMAWFVAVTAVIVVVFRPAAQQPTRRRSATVGR
jgi:hypothetical protein